MMTEKQIIFFLSLLCLQLLSSCYSQFEVSLSLFLPGTHTLIFPAVIHHVVYLPFMVWFAWFLLCSHLKAALVSLYSQVLVKAPFSVKE